VSVNVGPTGPAPPSTWTPPETIFGPIVSGWDVEQWALQLLHKWIGTYLAETERQHGVPAGTLARPRGWAIGPTFDKWPEDQIPGVLCHSPGTVERPWRDGSGLYTARWSLNVGVLCSARTQRLSHAHAQLYAAAVREVFLNRPSLEGHAAGTDWLGDVYDDLDYDDTRSLYAARNMLVVEVAGVGQSKSAGPVTPDDPLTPDGLEPWPPWPIADLVEVDVDGTLVTKPD